MEPKRENDRCKPVRRRRAARHVTLVLLALHAGAPGLADPTAGTPAGCWDRGAAPALFSWSASPAIACRDGAVSGAGAALSPGQSTDLPPAQEPAPGTSGSASSDTRFTFSGSTRVGLAVSF